MADSGKPATIFSKLIYIYKILIGTNVSTMLSHHYVIQKPSQ